MPPPIDAQDGESADKITRAIPEWPSKPQRLGNLEVADALALVADIGLLMLCLTFSAIGLVALSLHKKPTLDSVVGVHVERAAKLGPTLFPILFTAVAGRSLKVFGRYWIGKGVKLGVIESILSSQSVWSTIESQLLLRQRSILGAALLALWCLSPLGGQASLRLLQRSRTSPTTVIPLRYLSTGPASAASISFPSLRSNLVYSTALTPSTDLRTRPEDMWGNVKIPRFEELEPYRFKGDWAILPDAVQADDYSSLLGIPVAGRRRDRDLAFTLETSYLNVECGNFQQAPYSPNVTMPLVNSLSERIRFNLSHSAAQKLLPGTPYDANRNPWSASGWNVRSFFLDTESMDAQLLRTMAYLRVGNQTAVPRAGYFAKRELVFGSMFLRKNDWFINLAKCTVSQPHVDSHIHCPVGSSCRVTKMRAARDNDARRQALTLLDAPRLTGGLLAALPTVHDVTQAASSPAELFLNGTSALGNAHETPSTDLGSTFVDLSAVPPRVFSKRLGILLNTYYGQFISPSGYGGNLPANLSWYRGSAGGPADDVAAFSSARDVGAAARDRASFDGFYAALEARIASARQKGMPFVSAATSATAAAPAEVFVCRFAWLAVLLLASGTLFLLGGAAVVLAWRSTLAPDMLRCVASMTYANSSVFSTPPGGTALSAMQRARLLRNVTVRIGDTTGDNGAVGEIAFVAADERKVRSLEHRRLYH